MRSRMNASGNCSFAALIDAASLFPQFVPVARSRLLSALGLVVLTSFATKRRTLAAVLEE